VTAAAANPTIRAVVVQDTTERTAELVRILQRDGDIAVVGQATGATAAVGLVARIRPRVVVLDVNLDDGSGQYAVEQIMASTPTPILVLSPRIEGRRSPSAVEALVAGALDALPAPRRWTAELEADLRRSVRRIWKVPVIRHPRGRARTVRHPAERRDDLRPVVALAASTGGPSALATILAGLSGLPAPVLVVQHLHPDFTGGLIDWMARVSGLPVEIAEHGAPARPGRTYLAPGGVHLRLGADLHLELAETPVTLHRPSADQLFLSVAEEVGPAGVGVLLTGMGDDGARGLLAMHRAGGFTYAQDEASSAVFGMPRAAHRLGAVTDLLPLDELATAVRRAVSGVRA